MNIKRSAQFSRWFSNTCGRATVHFAILFKISLWMLIVYLSWDGVSNLLWEEQDIRADLLQPFIYTRVREGRPAASQQLPGLIDRHSTRTPFFHCRKLLINSVPCSNTTIAQVCLEDWIKPPRGNCSVVADDHVTAERLAKILSCSVMTRTAAEQAKRQVISEEIPAARLMRAMLQQSGNNTPVHWLHVVIPATQITALTGAVDRLDLGRVWQLQLSIDLTPSVSKQDDGTLQSFSQADYQALVSALSRFGLSAEYGSPHLAAGRRTLPPSHEQGSNTTHTLFVNARRKNMQSKLTSKWQDGH